MAPNIRMRVLPRLIPTNGRDIELNGDDPLYLQYRAVGDADWVDLKPWSELTGPQGPATIAVGAVTSLANGESATVVNVGTSDNMVLDFGIPEGEQGPAGTGNVDGPASSVIGHIAIFSDTTGKIIEDGGTVESAPTSSGYDVLHTPSIAARLNERLYLSALADLSDPADFSGALQYALDEGYHHIIIPGRDTTWGMSAGVILPARPIWIEGEGNPGRDTEGGTLVEYSGTGAAFKTTSGIKAPHFSNFKLYRTGTEAGVAAATLLGIEMPGLVEDALLENLWIEGFYNNVKAGATSFSYMDNVLSNKSTNVGILIANNATANGLQWSLNRCHGQLSGSSGIRYDTTNGTGPTSVGEVVNCSSYANSLYGLDYLDTSTSKLTGARILGGFFGEDRSAGIRISSHRGLHKIVGVECEIAGTAETGPPTATQAAANNGKGIFLDKPATYTDGTDFNDATISGCVIAFNTRSGLFSEFALVTVAGNTFRGNGDADVNGDRENIRLTGATTSVALNATGNNVFSAKGYGIAAQNDNHVVVGNLMAGDAGGTSLDNTLGAMDFPAMVTGVYANNKTT